MPTVLLADDEEPNRFIVTRMLARAGYDVVSAADGAEALKLAAQVRPAVILLDISMPIMDGFETARALRADPELRTIPLIGFTAHSLSRDRDRYAAAGFDTHLAKPFSYDDLCQTLADLIQRGASDQS